jgi:phage virion morphogenesis protein
MLSFEINDAAAIAALDKLSAHLSDLSEVMNSIGEQVEYQTEQRFLQGVSPEGIAWAPKSAATLAAYARRGSAVDSRPLFGLNADGIPLRQSFFRNYGIYAAVMQGGAAKGAFGATSRGTPIPWGAIPARPFLGLSETDRANIIATVDEWLSGIIET